MQRGYTGRLAPSPTGLLHLGHAATFWQAFQRARQAGGTLLFRNEDLDPHRSRPEFVEAMVEDLAWLGIRWQGEMVQQSQRLAVYREALDRLLAAGLAYPCTCSRRDLARIAQAPHESGGPNAPGHEPDDEPLYDGRCRSASAVSSRFDPGVNYRLRVPDGEAICFLDGNLGPQSFMAGCAPSAAPQGMVGDFLIWRRAMPNDPPGGQPSYQLACVVDDAAMGITEVVRGADLLKSTARQILLQHALQMPTPAYFHTQLLRDEHGARLAKRHDALALRTLRQQGRTPQQVLAMAGLG
ncbi:MAG: tRNA glutamyl-Q(34) synthetase GluQRS [Acidobacteriota bacterium]|nr:tRNA glutamyl-Q(34) synthetase GluQRS [Acidobacteriota bacterium]